MRKDIIDLVKVKSLEKKKFTTCAAIDDNMLTYERDRWMTLLRIEINKKWKQKAVTRKFFQKCCPCSRFHNAPDCILNL